MHGVIKGRLEDLGRLFKGLGFTVIKKDRKLLATSYVGIKGRWHLKAKVLLSNLIWFDFHWDWLIHLAYVFGSDHRKKPVIYYRQWVKPLLKKFNLQKVILDVKA